MDGAVLFIGGLAVLAALAFFLIARFSIPDQQPAQEIFAEEQRLQRLIKDAKKRYPKVSTMTALSMYKLDNLELIRTLKKNDGKADVIEALKFSLRDQRIMEQEIARLFNAKVNRTSSFNKLTAAQA